jgi:hypothetical protein
VKNTSGRIWARPHRATVAKTRQQIAKPVLNSGEGWEIPCQPRLNSSINFVIGFVTSRDQRIQNKADNAFERTGYGVAQQASLRSLRDLCGGKRVKTKT